MSDSPAVPSVLGIEAVEWFAEPGENLTVRVTGRWRRRRPAWSGQPTLVIETGGRRARFPAMPEPPSLTGAGPGTWRISFAVPGGLAPDLGGRSWLQFGSVVVPLPAAVAPLGAGAEGHVGSLSDHDLSPSEAPLPPAEAPSPPAEAPSPPEALSPPVQAPSPPPAEASAAELALRVQALEEDLAAARLQAEELSGSLTERERSRRAAEQRAHAEQALRRDLARQLSVQSDEGQRARQALGELAGAEARIREVEAALRDARRRGDEAEQVAAAAAVARERAERRAVEAEQERERERDIERERELEANGEMQRDRARGSGGAELDRLRFERGLVGRRAIADRRVPAEPRLAVVASSAAAPAAAVEPPAKVSPPAAAPVPGRTSPTAAAPPPGPGSPQHSEAAREALIAALRRELEVRAGGDSALRARLIDAESRLAARVLIERRTASILVELRRELDELRSAFERERAARAAAEHRAVAILREASGRRGRLQQASEAITELREALDVSRVMMRELQPLATDDPGTDPEPTSSHAVEPQRLNDARVRLRQAVAPQETEAGPSAYGPAHTTSRTWLIPIVRRLARTNAVVREWIKRAQSE